MNKNTNTALILNLAQFKKFAKRLFKDLNNTNQQKTVTISEVYEKLSQGLGFRNYSAIIEYFEQSSPINSENIHFNFFSGMNMLDIISCFNFFIDIYVEKKLQFKIKQIIESSIPPIYNTAIQENVLFDSQQLIEYLEKKVFYDDAHFIPDISILLEKIKQFEIHNPILFSNHWFVSAYKGIVNNKTIYTTNKLPHNMSVFYNEFTTEEWNQLFSDHMLNGYVSHSYSGQSGSTAIGTASSIQSKSNVPFRFSHIELCSSIKNHISYDNSWLQDDIFQRVLFSIIKNKELKTFTLIDLLLYSFKIANKSKRELFRECLKNLFNYYPTVVEYSQTFSKLVD